MASSRVGHSNSLPHPATSAKDPADRPVSGKRTSTSGVREVILEGRRYHLVPLDEGPAPDRDFSVASVLTGRELQIVVLVAEGRVNKQIADALRISDWTVSTHMRRIFAKLGVDTRAAMVSRCADLLAKRGR